MTVYEAIHRMRELTARRQPFSLSYMTYSMQRGRSHGPVTCEHALLVKNPKDGKGDYQDYMLTYRDQDTQEVRQLWQPLLTGFNGVTLTSID